MQIYFTDYFKKLLKKLLKKFPHAKDDLLDELDQLDLAQEISIGRGIFKIRIKSSDLHRGKSSGLRSYIYCYRKRDLLVPLCIYPKSERENISESELEWHLQRNLEDVARDLEEKIF